MYHAGHCKGGEEEQDNDEELYIIGKHIRNPVWKREV
jgi:hypothetical protein